MNDELAERLLKALEDIDRRLTHLETRTVYVPQIIYGPPYDPTPNPDYQPGITWPNTVDPLPGLPIAICGTGFYSYPGDSGHTLIQ